MPTVSVSVDASKARAALAGFRAALAPEMVATGRTVAAYGAGQIVGRVEGLGPNIRRVDTHRYASSWAQAGSMASGRQVGDETAAQPGDGYGDVAESGNVVVVVLESEVPYGPELEYGTATMTAGFHVQSTLEETDRHAAEFLDRGIRAAWGS